MGSDSLSHLGFTIVVWLLVCAAYCAIVWAVAAFVLWEPRPGYWSPIVRWVVGICLVVWCATIRVPPRMPKRRR